MPLYSILHVDKFHDQGGAQGRSQHNYREGKTPNADPERLGLNKEYLNLDQVDYWTLGEARIEEGIAKTARGKPRTVKSDQVHSVEILLAASPDWFKRGPDGEAVDMRESKWVADNLQFLKDTFGEKNVVGFVLHQDEKSPHIHALVIPLTEKGHLCASEIFSRETLGALQTKYGEKMAPHGLERGVEGSRRQHVSMKHLYGQQAKTEAELGVQLGPAVPYHGEVQVASPGHLQLNPVQWAANQSEAVAAQVRGQVAAANERADKAQVIASEAGVAKIQVGVLQKQLRESEGEKNRARGDLAVAAKRLAGGEAPVASLVAWGNKLLDQERDVVRLNRQEMVKIDDQVAIAERQGNFAMAAQLNYGDKKGVESRNEPLEVELRRYAGGRARLADLDAELAQQAAEKAAISQQQALLAEEKRVEREKQEAARLEAGFAQARAEQAQAKQRQLDIVLDHRLQELRNGRNALAEINPRADQFERQGNYAKAAEIRYMEAAPIEDKNKRAEAELMAHAGGVARLKALDEEPARLAKQAVLDLLDKRIASAGWRIGPDQLTACLLVPADKVERVTAFFGGNGTARGAQLPLPGEPPRADGLVAVGVKYGAGEAHRVGAFFEKVRTVGQVVEPAQYQARREQLQAQPAPTPAPREIQQERPRSNDIEID